MKVISIDWEKARSKPNERQKIEGKVLTDIRLKIDALEKEVVSLRKELDLRNTKIVKDQIFSLKTSEHLDSVLELYNYLKIQLDERGDTLEHFRTNLKEQDKKMSLAKKEQDVLKTMNANLQKSLIKLQKENIELDSMLTELKAEKEHEIETAIYDLVKKVAQKNKEIEELQHALAESENKTKMVNDGLEITIQDQLKIIDKLRANLTKRTNELLDINKKVAELEEKLLENEMVGKIISGIKQILFEKGFLSDKEFETIYSDAAKEQFIANL
ncbi:MAG: hypothetical protein JW891_12305 [Candidatus Lokiarchaeota archaeon]|nr:hypothetical protein [Candidatus Lokiarchaeota archaeon]